MKFYAAVFLIFHFFLISSEYPVTILTKEEAGRLAALAGNYVTQSATIKDSVEHGKLKCSTMNNAIAILAKAYANSLLAERVFRDPHKKFPDIIIGKGFGKDGVNGKAFVHWGWMYQGYVSLVFKEQGHRRNQASAQKKKAKYR